MEACGSPIKNSIIFGIYVISCRIFFLMNRRIGLFLELLPRNSKQDRHCTYKRNIEARWRNHFLYRKAMNNTCSECLSIILGILSSVACQVLR
jgi:hypothetical protein